MSWSLWCACLFLISAIHNHLGTSMCIGKVMTHEKEKCSTVKIPLKCIMSICQSWQDFNFCHYRRFWVANICTFCLYISYEWYLDWEKEGICITPILSDLYKAWSRFSFKRMPLYCSAFVFKVYMIYVFFLNYFLCWCVDKLAIYSLISLVYAKQVYLDFKIDSVLYDTTEANYKCPLQQDLCGVKLFLLGGNYAIPSWS